MAIYEWSDRLSIGDDNIDRQHKVLISYVNTLAEAVEKKEAQGMMLGFLLGNLVTYTKVHFIYEEMLFHAHHYPGIDDHKSHHQNLNKQVDEFHARFKSGDATLGPDLLNFLMDWLNNHILKSDLAYVEFLNARKRA